LQLIEGVRLLLGGAGHHLGLKDLTECRIIGAPALLDERFHRGETFAVRCRQIRPPVAADGEPAE
jgi:hypothetical protein